MKIREVAQIVRKSEDTVLRAVRRLFPEVETSPGVPVVLNEFQAYMVLKAFESPHHVNPPQSAGRPPHPAELPSGAQIRELRSAVERALITREQFQALLGLRPVSDDDQRPAAVGGPSPAAAEGFPPRLRQALAVGSRILEGQARKHLVPAGERWLPGLAGS